MAIKQVCVFAFGQTTCTCMHFADCNGIVVIVGVSLHSLNIMVRFTCPITRAKDQEPQALHYGVKATKSIQNTQRNELREERHDIVDHLIVAVHTKN